MKRFSLLRPFSFVKECLSWDKTFTRMVFFIAIPMMLQQLVTTSLHIVDGLMVSGLGDVAYSAVTQANRITFLFQLVCFGTFTGTGIFLSQYWGAKDIPRMRQSMGLALIFSIFISLLFITFALLFPHVLIGFFLPPGESADLAVRYLRIVVIGYLFFAIDGVFAVTIKSAEKTHYPMFAGFVSIGINTLLNYVLIFGKWGAPALGVEGAALATVIATFLSMCINISFSYGKHLPAGATPKQWFAWDGAFTRKFVKTTAPVVLNESIWALGITTYSIFYGSMGDVAVAATGITSVVGDLIWVAMFALTHATAIILGKTLGQGDRDTAYLYAKRLLVGTVLTGFFFGMILIIFRSPMVSLFSGLSPEAREKAKHLLLITGFALSFRAFNSVNVVGILRSGGATIFSLVLEACALWLISVPMAGLAALVWHLPLEAVFMMTLLEEVVKVFVAIPYFRSKKWIKVLTEEEKQLDTH